MIGNNAQHRIGSLIGAIIHLKTTSSMINDWPQQITFVVRRLALQNRSHAFQTHSCINGRARQAAHDSIRATVELHEYQVPDFDESATAVQRKLLVLLAGYLTRKVFFTQLLKGVEALIDRVPVVRSLYNATRQIVVPFADSSKLPFSE